MEYDFLMQSNAFLFSIIMGCVFWVLYEIFKSFRLVFNIKGLFLFILDIIYMLICTIAVFFYSLAFLNGSVRFFIPLGIILAFFTLYFSVGKIFDKLLVKLIVYIKKIFNKILNLFKKIMKKLLKILYKVLYNMFEKICKFVSFFKNRFKLLNLNKKGNKYGK